jgi:DNA repair protein RecN (Recombination protein N)
MVVILDTLGMPNVRFDIQVKLSETYYKIGKDEIQFLFAANKGTDFGILKKSGFWWKMSRIMLAVKAILAQYSKLPTLIFDEIDTGVSGELPLKWARL